jgi:hypothetical protein
MTDDQMELTETQQILRSEVRKLPVALLEHEVVEKGRQHAELQAELTEMEAAKKAAAKNYTAQINLQKDKITEIATEVLNRQEVREVEVDIIADWKTGTACPFRKDTGEPIEKDRRQLTDAERQQRLNIRSDSEGDDKPKTIRRPKKKAEKKFDVNEADEGEPIPATIPVHARVIIRGEEGEEDRTGDVVKAIDGRNGELPSYDVKIDNPDGKAGRKKTRRFSSDRVKPLDADDGLGT